MEQVTNARPPVLVTGAAGYIGGQMLRTLQDANERVIGLDNLSTGSRGTLPPDLTFVEGDVADEPLVADLVRRNGVEDVLHFAAFVDVAESEREGGKERYFKNNTEGTERFVRAAVAGGAKRILFSSTAAVYGDPAILPAPEDAPLEPVSNYGRSKLAAERLVREATYRPTVRHAILRYFNVAGTDPNLRCGYRTDVEPTHLIRRTVRVALGLQERLDIYGTDYPTPDGTCIRDYIHVEDVARAHLAVLQHLRGGGESDTYNIGIGKGYSVLEVKQEVEQVSGLIVPSNWKPRRPGDPSALVADAAKLRELGWTPRHKLKQMVAHELAWLNSRSLGRAKS